MDAILDVLRFVLLVLLGVGVYFAPSVVAHKRGHRNVDPIVVINLFLGWTLIGWVIVLAWSLSANVHVPETQKGRP